MKQQTVFCDRKFPKPNWVSGEESSFYGHDGLLCCVNCGLKGHESVSVINLYSDFSTYHNTMC